MCRSVGHGEILYGGGDGGTGLDIGLVSLGS